MRRKLPATLLGFAVVSTLGGIAAAQSSFDCSPLQGGSTPALYGLCVAVCEAHDCTPDFSAQNPFANCTPADKRLVDLYNRLKQPSDPDLPCLSPQSCPCFTQEQVDAFPTPYLQCIIDVDFGQDLTTNIIVEQGVAGAQVGLGSHNNATCAFLDDGNFVFLTVTSGQALACRQILINTIEANQDQCLLFEDDRP